LISFVSASICPYLVLSNGPNSGSDLSCASGAPEAGTSFHGTGHIRVLESSTDRHYLDGVRDIGLRKAGSHVMELLRAGAEEWGLKLSPEQIEAFEVCYQELVAWNEKANLTAITSYEEVQTKHFLDSLSCLQVLANCPVEISCIDIGSGAGFPGLPVKIVWPQMHLTLLEATGKKADFLEHIVARLGVGGVEVVRARAEEVGQRAEYRESFQVALARAVAALEVLAEYALPLLGLGGVFVAQKGRDVQEEVRTAEAAVKTLGGELQEVKPVRLPGLSDVRHLVVVRKVSSTPREYPRRPGIPAKRPLGRI
jgi:16S rRNA (guanine527-N7)-methyltransferase